MTTLFVSDEVVGPSPSAYRGAEKWCKRVLFLGSPRPTRNFFTKLLVRRDAMKIEEGNHYWYVKSYFYPVRLSCVPFVTFPGRPDAFKLVETQFDFNRPGQVGRPVFDVAYFSEGDGRNDLFSTEAEALDEVGARLKRRLVSWERDRAKVADRVPAEAE